MDVNASALGGWAGPHDMRHSAIRLLVQPGSCDGLCRVLTRRLQALQRSWPHTTATGLQRRAAAAANPHGRKHGKGAASNTPAHACARWRL